MRLISAIAVAVTWLAFGPLNAFAQSAGAVYDANGQLVGLFAGEVPGREGTAIHSLRGYRFQVSPSGRVDTIDRDIGGISYSLTNPHFESVDCTGAAYLVPTRGADVPGGMVTRLGAAGIGLGYVPKAPAISTITIRSFLDNGQTCIPLTQPAPTIVVPVLPNDPSVSGVPNSNFTPPLRLEVVPMTSLFNLFQDGFESVQRNAACERIDSILRLAARTPVKQEHHRSIAAKAGGVGPELLGLRVRLS